MSVLQVAPKRVRTQLHNILQIWSAQLPPESSTGLPHWELHPSSRSLLYQGGSRAKARASKNATKTFKKSLSSFIVHLVFIYLGLFSRVIAHLFLTVIACFLVFLWEDESLDLYILPLH